MASPSAQSAEQAQTKTPRTPYKAQRVNEVYKTGQTEPTTFILSVRPRRAMRAFKRLEKQLGSRNIRLIPPPVTPGQLAEFKRARVRATQDEISSKVYRAKKLLKQGKQVEGMALMTDALLEDMRLSVKDA